MGDLLQREDGETAMQKDSSGMADSLETGRPCKIGKHIRNQFRKFPFISSSPHPHPPTLSEVQIL